MKSYADIVKKKTLGEVGTGDVEEHESSGKESSNGFDDLDCGETSLERDVTPRGHRR